MDNNLWIQIIVHRGDYKEPIIQLTIPADTIGGGWVASPGNEIIWSDGSRRRLSSVTVNTTVHNDE